MTKRNLSQIMVAAEMGTGMQANLSSVPQERSRRKLSQEMLALCAWASPGQSSPCDLSEVLSDAPAYARVGLALWLRDAAFRAPDRSEPEMKPERFPQRRSTRLMIPHTAGNSDRVLFSLRRPELDGKLPENGPAMPMDLDIGAIGGVPVANGTASNAGETGTYQVQLQGERRNRGGLPRELDGALTEFTGVPAPAWIMAQGSRLNSE